MRSSLDSTEFDIEILEMGESPSEIPEDTRQSGLSLKVERR